MLLNVNWLLMYDFSLFLRYMNSFISFINWYDDAKTDETEEEKKVFY